MIRGTTPTHIFNTQESTRTLAEIRVFYSQGDRLLFTKTEDDVTLLENAIKVRLSQQETMMFSHAMPAKVQLKVLTIDGIAKATPVKMVPVGEILSEEVF